MPDSSSNKLKVHVNVEITAEALQAVVANAKRTVSRDADGTYHVDTAEYVSTLISRFLAEKDFDSFVMDIENYGPG